MRLWGIVGVYVGGVIGAGFASGQEMTVFFVKYGWTGLVGILAATLFLTMGTALIIDYSARKGVMSYADILNGLDPRLTRYFDLLYSLFLLIGTSVMFAGIGALGTSYMVSLLLRLGTGVLIYVVLQKGVGGVTRVSGWLAPIMVLIFCTLAIYRLSDKGLHLPLQGSWLALESAVLYASYNLGFSMAVLASIHHVLKSSKDRWKLALLANLILGVSMVLLYFALNTLTVTQLKAPFPLVHLVEDWGKGAIAFYRFMLWGAMYSTAIAHTLALVSRFFGSWSLSWNQGSILVIVISLSLSYFGFSTLISTAYPILGLAGLWIMANLVRERFA